MKMSLCNTLRLFALSTTVLLSIVGSPVPGLVKRHKNIITKDVNQDLMNQESLTVELKNNFKRPNDINSLTVGNAKDDANLIPLDSDVSKKNTSKVIQQILTDKVVHENSTAYVAQAVTKPLDSTTEAIPSNLDSFQTQVTLNSESKYEDSVNELHPTETIQNVTYSTQNDNAVTDKNQTEVTTVTNKPFTEMVLSETEIESKGNYSIQLENEVQVTDVFQNNNAVANKKQTEVSTVADKSSTEVLLSEFEKDTTTPVSITVTTNNISGKSIKFMDISSPSKAVSSSFGKEYTIIERRRVTTTTDNPTTFTDTSMDSIEVNVSTASERPSTITDKAEVMIKLETGKGRISLQDTMTSDIPSLEQLKTDLLSYPKLTTESSTDSYTTTSFIDKKTTEVTTPTTTTSLSTNNFDPPNTVSSKRAGYLDLSLIVKETSTGFTILKPNGTDLLQGPFEAETPDMQDETPDDKMETRAESQGQLTEDAIKEELLKEETLNDNEENANRNRDDQQQTQPVKLDLPSTGTTIPTEFDSTAVLPVNSVTDDNLSVKPISSDKVKNTVLYPVNPNYKPLKKIEVQPAKPFVRDPDDNSWRNESLSSLGIVFKPKNSSKPFTQVLKNKTETEWNNLSEKDRKSEVPDLRERLEQIAQKRKSKKKKIDSYGNVFYTDYEESSSSEENTSKSHVKDLFVTTVTTTDVPLMTDITIVTPIQSTSITSTSEEINGFRTLSTNSTTTSTTPTPPTAEHTNKPIKEFKKVATPKPPKLFNLFDYYESTDDDDISDYLNMAKIDLKKFTVPMQTIPVHTTYTSPPFSILYTQPMTHYTSERKGTVQYFPPRTTKRPGKNKQDNIRHKSNSLTLPDSPKSVLPISLHKLPATPHDGSIYYTNSPDLTKDQNIRDEPKSFNRNPYLTTPPLTTLPDESFGAITDDVAYHRANYVIKQYKDYMHRPQQENDHGPDKTSDFMGYTQPPEQGVTVNDLIKGSGSKDDRKMDDDYDYEPQFPKDVLDRFVANFNENTKRFNSDFPLLYNNSIVHGPSYNDKDAALSKAYFRRPYSNQGHYKPLSVPEPSYDPNCDNVTVELSPAYELHYYVPEQEEKQEAEPKPITIPVRYRL